MLGYVLEGDWHVRGPHHIAGIFALGVRVLRHPAAAPRLSGYMLAIGPIDDDDNDANHDEGCGRGEISRR